MPQKTLYIDLDNTLVDFGARLEGIEQSILEEYRDHADDIPGIFALMPPMPGALDAFRELAGLFDTYILSTAPWDNPSAWTDKLLWVRLHLGAGPTSPAYKRLILSHHKNLNRGDFLVDDRDRNGAADFEGELIRFGTPTHSDWPTTLAYLRERA